MNMNGPLTATFTKLSAVAAAVLAVAWHGKDVVLPSTYDEFQTRLNACMLDTVIDPLYLEAIRIAAAQFGEHGWKATVSGVALLQLVMRPVVWLVWQFGRAVLLGFYEFVICRGIASPTAVAQMQAAARAVIQWQMNRTRRELAIEAAIVVGLMGLYYFLQFLKRRRYLDRIKQWGRAKQRAASQLYRVQLQRLAQVSVVLSIMTPHAIFLLGASGFNLLFPQFCRWIAVETRITSVLSTWFPLITTIILLFDTWRAKEDSKRKPDRTNRRRQSSRGNRRKSLVETVRKSGGSVETLVERQEYMIHYWMVRAGVKLLKLFFKNLPFATSFLKLHPLIVPFLCQAELLFWVWVLVVPAITPAVLESYQPYKTPVDFLADLVLGDPITKVYNGLESVVPARIWTDYIVFFSDSGANALTMIGILSRSRKESIVGLISESRALVIPSLLLFIWPISKYALMFVCLCVPITKSFAATKTRAVGEKRTLYHWLQTWVLHVGLSLIFDYMEGLLRWIPFASFVVFFLYAYLSLSPAKEIDVLYRDWVQEELQTMCILPQDETQQAPRPSKIAGLVAWVIERLPKASNEDDRSVVVASDDTGENIDDDGDDSVDDSPMDTDDDEDEDFVPSHVANRAPDPPSDDGSDGMVHVRKVDGMEPNNDSITAEEKENSLVNNSHLRRRRSARRQR